MKFNQRLILSVMALLIGLHAPRLCAEITINGVEAKLEKNIKAHLALSREECDAPAWRLQQRRQDVNKQTRLALQAFGYYNPVITKSFTQTDDCWQLSLEVSSGPQVKFRKIDIQWPNSPQQIHPQLQRQLQHPPFAQGQPLNHQLYDNYKSQLMETAHAWGYWQASFQRAQLQIYPQEQAADVHLHITLGPRYSFGAYHFSDTLLDNDLIKRLAEPLQDEPYALERIQDSYQRLQNSGYFRQVVISPEIPKEQENTRVPLNVNLAMSSKHSFGAGVGYSTDLGARVHGNYRNRYYNSAGHRLRAQALWSPKLSQISGTYAIPREDAAKEWYELSAGFVDEVTRSYAAINQSFNARAITQLPHDWIANTGIHYLSERYRVADEDERKTTLYIPGIGFSWTSADQTTRQKRGLRFESGITLSHQSWFSDVDYIQAYTRTKGIYSPTKRLRIISRVELAGTIIDSVNQLPASLRYFAGGDNSVRGYGYKSLGTRNAEGDVVGGGNLAVASLELDYLIFKNWSLSTFYDMGDAYNEQPDYKTSQGIGLHWYSPVGALSLDIAFPNHSDEDYRLHISVGADL